MTVIAFTYVAAMLPCGHYVGFISDALWDNGPDLSDSLLQLISVFYSVQQHVWNVIYFSIQLK